MTDTKPRNTAIQKLQRAIVNGLEDVKGQDIVVFNTEAMSPLFERVIVASGTSNRQTKALANSVSEAVKAAGFPKPRIEGADNGEWIIVDCGQAVAHVMQPVIRQYYRLEDIWGGKTVRLKPSAAAAATKTTTNVETATADTPPKLTRRTRTNVADSSANDAPPPRRRTLTSSVTNADTSNTSAPRPRRNSAKTEATNAAAAPRRRSAPIKTVVVNDPDAKKRKTPNKKA